MSTVNEVHGIERREGDKRRKEKTTPTNLSLFK